MSRIPTAARSLPNLPKLTTQVSRSTFAPQLPEAEEKNKEISQDPPVEMAPAPTPLDYFLEHVTFYRLHLAAFTFIPLVVSGIFYACNGRFHISYLDSLFLCYSAMTVTGLSTVNLSTLTAWQQVILYLLMIIGDITIVSWVMVLIRKRFFRIHCEYTETVRRKKTSSQRRRSRSMWSISSPIAPFRQREPVPNRKGSTTNMAAAVSAAGDGGPSASGPTSKNPNNLVINVNGPTPPQTVFEPRRRPPPTAIPEEREPSEDGDHVLSDSRTFTSPAQDDSSSVDYVSHSPVHDPELDAAQGGRGTSFGDFGMTGIGSPNSYGPSTGTDYGVTSMASPKTVHYHPMMELKEGRPIPRRGATMLVPTHSQGPLSPKSTRTTGFGGYPGPLNIINRVARRAAPRAYSTLERKLTIMSEHEVDASKVSWLNFSGLVVGRNSDFRTETLSVEQVEQLGGAEYRALRLLSYLIPTYFVACQLFSYVLFAPWLSTTSKFDQIFDDQPRLVKKPWFSLFQVMGAYTGGGLSLVDLGMVPFQDAYLMIFGMMFSILAGNHALPIFLRFIIWSSSRITADGSGMHKAFTFLLDHPRRCFLYLFPSHQTWFLLLCLAGFSAVEWAAFLILNIGLPQYESIPAGPRTLAGLFQGLAARASGFSIVPLATFSPALQFMYVVMMYVAIYPVAMSIRSTNVYEEQSLGIFEKPEVDEEEPQDFGKLNRTERIHKYVGWHLRRQMSIDIWWLVWGVFLVMVVERGNIMNEEKKWFDAFRILFELVSAFGGIGLTLGIPTENYSFVGAMKPLSKLIVIVIMVRGRHRGLPVAVDRAVQLPKEMVTTGLNRKPSMAAVPEKQPPDFTNSGLNAA